MADPAKARKAAEQLGKELAKSGAKLLVYGGPYLEEDVVRGFVAGKPAKDRSVLMWYSKDQEPPPFPEEQTHPNLFERRVEKGAEWEIAFYRSVTRADGVILMGGSSSTKICGQVAIGTRLPVIALAEFGGGAAAVWQTLSAGEDLPNREEIDLMARPWDDAHSAADCVKALLAQRERRRSGEGAPHPILSILAVLLFLLALSIVPWVWGQGKFEVWMLFLTPVLAGGAGAAIRPLVDRMRGTQGVAQAVLATVAVGLVAGGVAGVLFITAQLTANPDLATGIEKYAQRSIPFALGVGFVAGLTADAVFGKLLGLEVVKTLGIEVKKV
jgi:fluoride ion exporter CrcB/FEX